MPFGSVRLIPGVNVERTPTLNEAGYSVSSLIRFKDSLAQKLGGWAKYFQFTVPAVPRDLHAWQDLNLIKRLAVGSTTGFGIIANGVLQNLTPQTFISTGLTTLATTSGNPQVELTDPGILNVTTFDSVYFNTPMSVGGIVLSGLYSIAIVTGTTKYKINGANNATGTVSIAPTAALPIFTTASGSSIVSVALNSHGLVANSVVVFPLPTTVGGIVVQGTYTVLAVVDANTFTISTNTQATSTATVTMNVGVPSLTYYITIGPIAAGNGYGLGAYGDGGYGTGVTPTVQTGTPLVATDYTSDNWGEIILACPSNGGIYYWAPTGGFQNLQLITSGPLFNGGIFVSMSQQILVAWGSTIPENIGLEQDPMLVQWSDVGNFFQWTPDVINQAGNFRIPIGSEIRGGMAVSTQNFIWTDLDLWAMNYIGPPNVFGFNKIGAGAGLAGSHAALQLRGNVYWMGQSNFYIYAGGGVQVLPCPVWDAVFQNLNTAFIKNVRAMPNTPFNEAGWLYPSAASANGECDSYVKMNITEPGNPWDYGPMSRSAWIDQTILGPPVAATPQGVIYQHETTNDADGGPLMASFTTGYFLIAEGEDFPFVDQVIPDMKWGFFGAGQIAQVQLTFNIINYPGDTPVSYGPYTVTQATEYISVRFRGRQMSITVQSTDVGSFWRLGRLRYRYSPSGRR